jgi:di/tricarboxylate transporter
MRMARIGPAVVGSQGPLSDELRSRLLDPILLTSLWARSALVLGIALLMTLKPAGLTSLVIIALAVAIGLLAGQLAARRRRHEYASAVD